MPASFKDRFIKCRVKLLRDAPFFGVLLLNSSYVLTEDVPIAATDGQKLLFNEKYMEGVSDMLFRSVLLHEVLHMALEHLERLKEEFKRDTLIANIACDIVVNGIIKDNGFTLGSDWISDDSLKHLSAKEIYNILRKKVQEDKDYIANKYGTGGNECMKPGKGQPQSGKEQSGDGPGAAGGKGKVNWRDVLNKASTISKSKSYGLRGAGLGRIFKEFMEPTINWRDALYKYITAARTDFEGFDRRFVHSGQYLDDLGGGKIRVMVFMDTSASVNEELLGEFIAEIRFAVGSLPQISGEMWCFDATLYPLGDILEVLYTPKITGGGGTSFTEPLEMSIKAAEEDITTQVVSIIFTDGYAQLKPLPEPDGPVVWCISPGGVDSDRLPFGEVLRIMK
jgi:predicted metal-dependent peptidase